MADNFDSRERLNFLRFDDTDRKHLAGARSVLTAGVDSVLEAFYNHAKSFPATARLFAPPRSMPKARALQRTHWVDSVFTGNFGEAYMRQVTRIGKVHEEVGLEPRWYLGGYAFTMTQLISLIVKNYKRDPDKIIQILHALTKALFLDMDLATSVYIASAKETASRLLNEYADKFEQDVQGSVHIVASASTELQATARLMSGAATTSGKQAEAVVGASGKASASVHSVASATEELSASIQEISRQISQSSKIARGAVAEAERTNQLVTELAGAAQKIGGVLKLINEIAGQTHLLALNATIEAAHAGAAGRGFAVVAQEVKNLAGETSKATEQISNLIHSIQSSTQTTVTAIHGIGKTITEMDAITSSIAAAIEQQGAATKEISRAAQDASSATQIMTDNVGGMARSAQETGESSGEVLQASEELSKQAEMLNKETTEFLRSIRSL